MITFISAGKLPKAAVGSEEAAVAAIKKKHRKIKKQAMTAAYTLLGMIPPAYAADAEGWTVDTSLLHYSETDRISVTEPTVGAQRSFADGRALSLLVTVDAISGSTPIGTLPQKPSGIPVTTTTPSGRSVTTTPGVVIPVSQYHDTRYGLDGFWQQLLGLGITTIAGGQVSRQSDFLSYGGNLSLAKDFNRKNTTLSLGFSPEYDTNTPHGGVPMGFSSQLNPIATSADKRVLSFLAGITQVINRETLMQWNYSQTRENGYLTDPYKQLSLVDPVTGDPLSSVYEQRPSSRVDHSFFWLTKYNLGSQDVVSASYRYFMDNWGIRAHTMDLNYHWQFDDQGYFEPHFRFYHQSQADFYKIGLISGDPLPLLASADQRLAAFNAFTIGLRYGWTFENGSLFAVRLEYYTQLGDNHPASAVGIQKTFDLSPALKAFIFQIQYKFDPTRLVGDLLAPS